MGFSFCSGEEPYSKQMDMLRAVETSRRVSVVGCNGSGKDWAAARVVLWWLHAFHPSKAIVTGPTSRQVEYIFWNEMRSAHALAADRLGGRMFRTSRYEIDDSTFALGFATNSPYNLQGFHSPNMLVVVTEAHAVGQADMDALFRLNPKRLLMTGNPFVQAGTFYDSHHSKEHLYETVKISAFDTPNVQQKRVVIPGMVTVVDVEDRRAEWGEENERYVGGVLGQFPDNLQGHVVPLFRATEAARRTLEPEGPVVLGCDVARYGKDKTVVVRRQGPVARIIWRVRGRNTMEVANWIKAYCDAEEVDTVVVDDTGVGGGVVDRLGERGLGRTKLVAFRGGSASDKKDTFTNLVTEVWWRMGAAYEAEELDMEEDPALIEQVSGRKYNRPKGEKITLESKQGKYQSPDEADALAMTFVNVAPAGGYRIHV